MSTSLISSTSSGPTDDKSFFTTSRMIISRVLNLIFPLVEVVLLGVTFGLNNSSSASELPENAASCNESNDLHLYSSKFLTRSINIICVIWLGLCCLAVIYQTIVFVIISKKRTGINYRQLLKWDIGLTSFFMWIFIDGAAGTFIMGFLWNAYNSVADLEGSPASIAKAIFALQYIAFVGMVIACMSYFFTVVMQTSTAGRCSSSNSCGTRGTSYGTQPPKDVPEDSETAY